MEPVGACRGTDEERQPEVEHSEGDDCSRGRRGRHTVGHEQRAERRVGDADATRDRTDQRRHQCEGVHEQRRGEREMDAEARQHEEEARAADDLAGERGPEQRYGGTRVCAQSLHRACQFVSRARARFGVLTSEPRADTERDASRSGGDGLDERPLAGDDDHRGADHDGIARRRDRAEQHGAVEPAGCGPRDDGRPDQRAERHRLGDFGRHVCSDHARAALARAVGVGEVGDQPGGAGRLDHLVRRIRRGAQLHHPAEGRRHVEQAVGGAGLEPAVEDAHTDQGQADRECGGPEPCERRESREEAIAMRDHEPRCPGRDDHPEDPERPADA